MGAKHFLIGTRLKDNNPREPNRTADVVGHTDKVTLHAKGRVAKIDPSRIFDDGKARKSGWSVVSS